MCPVYHEAAFETFHSFALNGACFSFIISGTSESLDFEIPCAEQVYHNFLVVDVFFGY